MRRRAWGPERVLAGFAVCFLFGCQTRQVATRDLPRIARGGERVEVGLCPATAQHLELLLRTIPGSTAGAITNTGSMEPTFDENYVAVVERRPFSSLAIGQVPIAMEFESRALVAHRIKNRCSSGWVTQGDACRFPDLFPVTEYAFTGFVVIAAVHCRTGAVVWLDDSVRDRSVEAMHQFTAGHSDMRTRPAWSSE